MFTSESAIFLLVSLLSAYIINSQIPKNILFVMLSILLAILLVFFGRFQLAFLQQKSGRPVMLIGLFLSSFFVQLLVIATGGLFSAFIIAMHLFTLAMSVLFNVSSAIVFLLLSVGLLMSSFFFDPQMQFLFKQDPWSVVLHGISFLVIIPLAHMLVSTYHLKDAISKTLSENLKNKELQDESIFRGIGEMIFILDRQKKVIFANEAVKRTLNLHTIDLVGNELTKILPLESQNNLPLNTIEVSLDQTMSDKSAHLVRGFTVLPKQTGRKMPVIIQIRPVEDKQIVVVITPDLGIGSGDQIDARIAAGRRKALITQLEDELATHQDNSLIDFESLLTQIEDMVLFKDLEIHQISEKRSFVESSDLISHILPKHTKLFNALQISPDYSPRQDDLVKTANLILHNNQFSLYSHTKHSTSTSLDVEWFETFFILLVKLISFFNSESPKHQITIRIGYDDHDQQVLLISTTVSAEVGQSINQILTPNYGTLNQKLTNQTAASGLEGVLAQKISQALNLNLSLTYDPASQHAAALITLPKAVN